MADRITQFERAIVFRIARGYFVLLAVAMVLISLGGVIMFAMGVSEAPIPVGAPPPSPTPTEPLTHERVLKLMEADAANASKIQLDSAADAGTSATEPSEQERLSRLQAQVQALFPEPVYTWADVLEEYCVDKTPFGCMRVGQRVKREGVLRSLNAALKGLSRREALDMLELLVRVLGATPVEQRGALIEPTIRYERARLREVAAAQEAYQRALAEYERDRSAAASTNAERHASMRSYGLYGVVAGLCGLVAVSLFLAFLAMERHLRRLESAAPPSS